MRVDLGERPVCAELMAVVDLLDRLLGPDPLREAQVRGLRGMRVGLSNAMGAVRCGSRGQQNEGGREESRSGADGRDAA